MNLKTALLSAFIFCFVIPCFSQQEEQLYTKAYNYIFKSKELAHFRDEIRKESGIIAKQIIVSDSIIENNPHSFLCAILKKKTKSNNTCARLIGADKLKTFDSLVQSYSAYRYSNTVKVPFKKYRIKKNSFVLSFSDIYKNTLKAEARFQSNTPLLFYFVFSEKGEIKNVFAEEIQNYNSK